MEIADVIPPGGLRKLTRLSRSVHKDGLLSIVTRAHRTRSSQSGRLSANITKKVDASLRAHEGSNTRHLETRTREARKERAKASPRELATHQNHRIT